MIGGVQPKVLLTQDANGNLNMDDEMGKLLFGETQMNWKLVRERDGLAKQSNGIKWLEWNEDGTFKEQFKEVMIGRSLLMSPFNSGFTWQTTEVIEIIEQREDYIKFKTKNSNYELFKIK
tara:strand:+ start:207 stop:566 length:360 start_codon:yes stop_codon:yes gene_type:complete